MTNRALLCAAALLSTSLTPISMVDAAWATPVPVADQNAPDEQAVCNDDFVNNQDDPSAWRATVTNANSNATAPTAVPGTDEPINYRANTGSTWSYVGFLGSSGSFSRNGGSPNLWAWATYDHSEWDNTLYDVQTQFSHSVTYTWTCHVENHVNHPTFVPDPPSNNGGGGNDGTCNNNSDDHANNNGRNQQNGGNDGGNNGCGNGNGGPNGSETTNGNGNGNNGCGLGNGGSNGTKECDENGNPGHWVDHYSWDFDSDNPETVTNNDINDGFDITQSNVPQSGHVTDVDYLKNSGPLTTNVRILSCISPGSKGGSWKPKDYYHGTVACSTSAFNAAPTLSGRTFDSPPTNSLPAY